MKRSVLIAILIALLLLFLSFGLYEKIFSVAPSAPPILTPVQTIVDAGARLPSTIDAGGLDAGGLDAGGLDAGVVMLLKAEVITLRGLVQTRSKDGAEWVPVVVGQELDADDSLRTGRNAEAKLRVGHGVEVRLSPRSEFSIREITEGVSRVRLESGRVSASVDENGARVLRVEARGSDAVAEARSGRFGMVTDGKGQVAVATETGSVKLTSRGKTVAILPGKQSMVVGGAAPSSPKAVPRSLFLKVAPPIKRTTNRRTQMVRGSTVPGSLVRAGEKVVIADRKGNFRVPVPLREGKNRIIVDVTDPSGRTQTQRLPEVMVDRQKPGIDAQVKWGDEQQGEQKND